MVVVMLHWQEIQKGGQTPWGSEVPLVHQRAERTSFVGTSHLGNQAGYLCHLPTFHECSTQLVLEKGISS